MNKICAIDITGKLVHILLMEGTKSDLSIVNKKPIKIELKDHADQNQVKIFHQNMLDFFNENGVTEVAIKSGSTGVYKSGPAVFKMEALIQLAGVNIQFVKPQTLSAFWKKCEEDINAHDLKKYQQGAFKLGYYFLQD